MAATDSGHGTRITPTNGKLRKEIGWDILDELGSINDVMRTADSIKTSDNFHLDSRELDGNFKVEIQYRRGNKGTVAVVLVDAGATSLNDFVTAVRGSLTTGTVWEVS